jgi:hypothetical protein
VAMADRSGSTMASRASPTGDEDARVHAVRGLRYSVLKAMFWAVFSALRPN